MLLRSQIDACKHLVNGLATKNPELPSKAERDQALANQEALFREKFERGFSQHELALALMEQDEGLAKALADKDVVKQLEDETEEERMRRKEKDIEEMLTLPQLTER